MTCNIGFFNYEDSGKRLVKDCKAVTARNWFTGIVIRRYGTVGLLGRNHFLIFYGYVK